MLTSLAGSPLEAAWYALGTPELAVPFDQDMLRCAQCGSAGPTTRFSNVVSPKFTNFDRWNYGGDRLCRPCAWGYATLELRRSTYLVDQSPVPAFTPTDRHDLGRLLQRSVPTTTAVVIPVRGRKHILPFAQWGHVCTDDTQIRWDDAAVTIFTALRRLRRQPAMTASALVEPAPPIAVIRAAPRSSWQQLLADWEVLTPWRHHHGWWDAAIALSTPTSAT